MVWLAETAIGLRLSGSIKARGFGATVTWKDRIWGRLVVGSVAVTVMVEVSPASAWVVSRWSTPLGLLAERVTESSTIGLAGRSVPGCKATRLIWLTRSNPETTW